MIEVAHNTNVRYNSCCENVKVLSDERMLNKRKLNVLCLNASTIVITYQPHNLWHQTFYSLICKCELV